jgi:hypothetical protein
MKQRKSPKQQTFWLWWGDQHELNTLSQVCNTFLSHSKRTKTSDKEKEKDACISCTSHGLESVKKDSNP